MSPAPLTASADLGSEIPAAAGSCRDRIEAALTTLDGESRRLARLGLELPMARCQEQRRYWMFLSALFSLPDTATGSCAPPGDASWPPDWIR